MQCTFIHLLLQLNSCSYSRRLTRTVTDQFIKSETDLNVYWSPINRRFESLSKYGHILYSYVSAVASHLHRNQSRTGCTVCVSIAFKRLLAIDFSRRPIGDLKKISSRHMQPLRDLRDFYSRSGRVSVATSV